MFQATKQATSPAANPWQPVQSGAHDGQRLPLAAESWPEPCAAPRRLVRRRKSCFALSGCSRAAGRARRAPRIRISWHGAPEWGATGPAPPSSGHRTLSAEQWARRTAKKKHLPEGKPRPAHLLGLLLLH